MPPYTWLRAMPPKPSRLTASPCPRSMRPAFSLPASLLVVIATTLLVHTPGHTSSFLCHLVRVNQLGDHLNRKAAGEVGAYGWFVLRRATEQYATGRPARGARVDGAPRTPPDAQPTRKLRDLPADPLRADRYGAADKAGAQHGPGLAHAHHIRVPGIHIIIRCGQWTAGAQHDVSGSWFLERLVLAEPTNDGDANTGRTCCDVLLGAAKHALAGDSSLGGQRPYGIDHLLTCRVPFNAEGVHHHQRFRTRAQHFQQRHSGGEVTRGPGVGSVAVSRLRADTADGVAGDDHPRAALDDKQVPDRGDRGVFRHGVQRIAVGTAHGLSGMGRAVRL